MGKKNTQIQKNVEEILDYMNSVFKEKDELLRAQSIVPIYYLVFGELLKNGCKEKLKKENFSKFRDKINYYKNLNPFGVTTEKYHFIQYNQLSLQGTNDAASIRKRVEILRDCLLEGAD